LWRIGITGLTTAIGLARVGHRVHILEKASNVVQNGGGIRVAPNAMSSLTRWGLEEEISRVASPLRGSKFYDSESHELFDLRYLA
jgi:2-polyprenyl-6-methoxyphenol hydroxylase-like FAD-dependent oxidoreductase